MVPRPLEPQLVNSNAIPKISVPAYPDRYVITLIGDTIWTIGRGKENDIVIKDPLISRQHAIIQSIAFKDFYLVYFSDLASRNGSLINRLPVKRQQLLVHGDQITLGNATLKFYYPEWTNTWDFEMTLP